MCIACSPLTNALTGGFAASRRMFLRGMGATAATVGFGGAATGFLCSEAMAQTDAGDTLYVGGSILTMVDNGVVTLAAAYAWRTLKAAHFA